MNLEKDKYIIVELIPTGIDKNKGDLIQLSAIKLNGLELQSRFDYRLNEEMIKIPDFLEIINYDKNDFIYKDSTEEILEEFKTWIEDLPLLIIDNVYTKNFLEDIENTKESVFKYLDTEYHDRIIEELIEKYNIEPTNYIVDILYESIIKHI